MNIRTPNIRTTFAMLGMCLLASNLSGNSLPEVSMNGKYSGLVQTLSCEADSATYGRFADYGWWNGGSWCGQQAEAGYWVWQKPNWYIFRQLNLPATSGHDQSAGGRYKNLVQSFSCPADGATYGLYNDYGWWGGGDWCGQEGKAGYWVWKAPYWYVYSGHR